jgi:dTDP-4-dehydrorhamnose 3,5-epimerase
MKIMDQPLEGIKLIRPEVFVDERGFFLETYRESLYQEQGIDCRFVQDNHSYSKKGVVRGMHFQKFPGQAKLISVMKGEIFDVVVDIRPDSPTFRKWRGFVLRAEEHEQLLIPIGFAHGFSVLSEEAYVCYKVTAPHNASQERVFIYNDPEIGIEWPQEVALLSEKDRNAPYFHEVVY